MNAELLHGPSRKKGRSDGFHSGIQPKVESKHISWRSRKQGKIYREAIPSLLTPSNRRLSLGLIFVTYRSGTYFIEIPAPFITRSSTMRVIKTYGLTSFR